MDGIFLTIWDIPHMMSLLNSVLIYEGFLNTTDAIFFSMERITREGTHEFNIDIAVLDNVTLMINIL